MEFSCKVTSTWSKGRERETAFTHRQFGEGRERKKGATGLHHRVKVEVHVGGIEGLAGYDDQFATETVGLAGGQNSHVEACQCGPPHDVLGKHGHQDDVR